MGFFLNGDWTDKTRLSQKLCGHRNDRGTVFEDCLRTAGICCNLLLRSANFVRNTLSNGDGNVESWLHTYMTFLQRVFHPQENVGRRGANRSVTWFQHQTSEGNVWYNWVTVQYIWSQHNLWWLIKKVQLLRGVGHKNWVCAFGRWCWIVVHPMLSTQVENAQMSASRAYDKMFLIPILMG